METRLGFIGAGNMAGAILNGILAQDLIPAEQISLSNPHAPKLEPYLRRGIYTTVCNREVAERSELIFLTVKPQMFPVVLPEVADLVEGKGVVSISPGYSVTALRRYLPGAHVIRAMPNTPVLVGNGVTALAEAPEVPRPIFHLVKQIFSSAGVTVVVPEENLNAVIAVSGSSPAYFFRLADAMVRTAAALGLDPDQALRLTAQTMEGAAKMLLETGKTAQELTRQVCSPGGTTLAALSAFDEYHLEAMVEQAMRRCVHRAEELGQ